MARKQRPSAIAWVFFAVFAVHVIGFLAANFRDDVQGMVWCGFMGIMWFHLADREANA